MSKKLPFRLEWTCKFRFTDWMFCCYAVGWLLPGTTSFFYCFFTLSFL